MFPELTCFKAYDIRGEISININEDIVYRVGRAVAQHLNSKTIVIGYDARETSPAFAAATAQGVMDAGSDVLDIGLAGTEEMYWAVTEFGASGGIEITASHNPINYNGLKIVKSKSRPLDDIYDFKPIKLLAESKGWTSSRGSGKIHKIALEARTKYIDHILNFIDLANLANLKIVINSGNGAAGPTVNAIVKKITEKNALVKFFHIHQKPDSNFPNGIPNPLLPENHRATAEIVIQEGADLGIAFDGDFDRCFFFDDKGEFVPGEYVVGLLAKIFLVREKVAKIVHDPRVIWNTKDIVSKNGGIAVQSKTGHAFIKQTMRSHKAVYGGEMSAHHYFRDFAYCDSGMIPWLLVAELLSKSGRSLANLLSKRYDEFPSSGEINFLVDDGNLAIKRVFSELSTNAVSIDYSDGISLEFKNWRFNLRQSNTEPLVRLNVECRGNDENVNSRVHQIATLLKRSK